MGSRSNMSGSHYIKKRPPQDMGPRVSGTPSNVLAGINSGGQVMQTRDEIRVENGQEHVPPNLIDHSTIKSQHTHSAVKTSEYENQGTPSEYENPIKRGTQKLDQQKYPSNVKIKDQSLTPKNIQESSKRNSRNPSNSNETLINEKFDAYTLQNTNSGRQSKDKM